jgi:hypothetical protein
MRVPWSEQKERKTHKEERRARKDKQKQAEWEKLQAEGGGEVGMVEAFRRSKKRDLEGDGAEEGQSAKVVKGVDQKAKDEDKGELDLDYKALKKEMKEERAGKKGKREEKLPVGGAFDDLD